MRRLAHYTTILLIVALFTMVPAASAQQNQPVRAVIFYSPSCPHCHTVINEVLPPLWNIYGGEIERLYVPPLIEEQDLGPPLVELNGAQLEILYVNTWSSLGQQLFQAAVERFDIPPEEQAVPTLIVGETRLLGSGDIPKLFPGIVELGLTQGGIDWPDLAGLEEALSLLIPMPMPEPTVEGQATETTPATSTPQNPTPSPISDFDSGTGFALSKLKRDPLGNSISLVVLIGMVFSVVGAVFKMRLQLSLRHSKRTKNRPPLAFTWGIPLLTLVGIIAAGYLTYVETKGVEAVCGPVGDCNTVQQSEYALLFSVIPVSALGLVTYIIIMMAWLLTRTKDGIWADLSTSVILALTSFGTLFSIYLTFLEPFVIGATCAWCLSSAVAITAQMWITIEPGTWSLIRLWRRYV
jgi:uncharacterized membrane protein